MINWKNITAEEFEELCFLLLENNNFTNLRWFGKGGADRGRDIIADKLTQPLANITAVQRWLIQCKRYTEKTITKSELTESFNCARQHNVQCYLLAMTNTLSADMKDWLDSIRDEYKFEIFIWEELNLRKETNRCLREVSERFPNLIKQGEIVEFYRMEPSGAHYHCNEIDEVGFYILNDYGEDDNIKYIEEFIQFIKSNGVTFHRKKS